MRLRRRVSDSFSLLTIPLICCAVVLYFGYSGLMGPRGLLAWHRTGLELAVKKAELARVQGERIALQRRITLLDANALDPDMLEEVTRGVLSEGRTGEVAVQRDNPRDNLPGARDNDNQANPDKSADKPLEKQ